MARRRFSVFWLKLEWSTRESRVDLQLATILACVSEGAERDLLSVFHKWWKNVASKWLIFYLLLPSFSRPHQNEDVPFSYTTMSVRIIYRSAHFFLSLLNSDHPVPECRIGSSLFHVLGNFLCRSTVLGILTRAPYVGILFSAPAMCLYVDSICTIT